MENRLEQGGRERRNEVPLGSYAVYFCGSKLTVHGETSLGTPS